MMSIPVTVLIMVPQLAEAVGPELVRSELVNAYVALLKDNEAEVRTAGAGQIPGISLHLLTFHVDRYNSLPWLLIGFSKLVERDTILAKILPCVQALSTDSSQHVRAALGNHISGLAPLLGKEATIDHLLPLFLQLLKDDFPDVRLNIISKLELVNNGTYVASCSLLQILTMGEQ
jgi:serine/threonine-protein phosphatase 2A regulatory subunit A